MLDLKSYAQKFRVPLVRDECGELNIPGRHGHIYVHSAVQLGWCLMNGRTASRKNAVIRRYVRTGQVAFHVEGDTEAIFLFDPNDAALFRDCLRFCGVEKKRRRKLSASTQPHRGALKDHAAGQSSRVAGAGARLR